MIGDHLRQLSSSSYYSWFLHGQENGGRVRTRVEKEFLAHTIQFVQEMAEKCRAFLCPQGHPVLDAAVWKILVDELGQNNPMFVRDGHKSRQLLAMIHAAYTVGKKRPGGTNTQRRCEEKRSCLPESAGERILFRRHFSRNKKEPQRGSAILSCGGLSRRPVCMRCTMPVHAGAYSGGEQSGWTGGECCQ